MRNSISFILILLAFNTKVFGQVDTYELWKTYENTQIASSEIIGDWYASDSIQSKISFVRMAETNIYIEGKKGGVGGPYSFRVDKNGVFVNGSSANWPPYYCTLIPQENNTLEIRYWNFVTPESERIIYKRTRRD